MRYAAIALCLLLAGLAGTCKSSPGPATTSAVHNILADETIWGKPPENNAPVDIPPLPDLQGWYWLLGAQYPDFLAAGQGVVVAGGANTLAVLDGQSGKARWVKGPECRFYADDPALCGELLICNDFDAATALNLADGSERWRLEKENLLAASPQRCWLLDDGRAVFEPWERVDASLSEVDSTSGKLLRQVQVHKLRGMADGVLQSAPALVIKSGGEFVAYLPDGQERRSPASAATTAAWMRLGKDGVLTSEFSTAEDSKDDSAVFSFIELPSGRLRWRKTLAAESGSVPEDAPKLCDKYALYTGADEKLHALRLTDGKDVWASASSVGLDYAGRDGSRLAYAAASGKGFVHLVDLNTGKDSEVFEAAVEPEQLCLVGDWLYFFNCNTSFNAVTTLAGDYNNVFATWGLKLQDGKAQTGRLALVNPPQTPEDLRRRFFASARPVEDPALMRELVAGGTTQLLDLLQGTGAQQGPQLDALLAAALHSAGGTLDHEGGPFAGVLDVFLPALEKKLSPDYTPHLLAWLEDDSLIALHPRLTGLLAHSGGPQAARWLTQFYGDFNLQRYDPARPPFSGCGVEEYSVSPRRDAGRIDTLTRQTYRDEVEVEDGSSRYSLFAAGLLATKRELYIGIGGLDKYGSGFDEVLPTGLTDCYFDTIWHGYTEVHRWGPIAIRVDGDKVSVTHHTPVYMTVDDGDGHTRQQMSDTTYGPSQLSLRALRQDSDSDGLTDILERDLCTDPHKPDSDADGIPDNCDRLPNVDPAKWTAQQRGLARALIYYFNLYPLPPVKDECGHLPPFQTTYFSSYTGSGVAIPTNCACSIYLDKSAEARIAAIAGPCSEYSRIRAGWDENVMGWQHVNGSPGILGDEISGLADLGVGNICVRVELVSLDGEYYPVNEYTTCVFD